MSSGGFRSESLSTEAETTIEVLRLATHKLRHYLYAVLPAVFLFPFYIILYKINFRRLIWFNKNYQTLSLMIF